MEDFESSAASVLESANVEVRAVPWLRWKDAHDEGAEPQSAYRCAKSCRSGYGLRLANRVHSSTMVEAPMVVISNAIEGEWLGLAPVQVGDVPSTPRPPDRYVTLAGRQGALLRVDVYAFRPDSFVFDQAVVWRDLLVVGYGSHVHAISISSRTVVSVALDSYFGHLYPTEGYLLIASGEELLRMEPDGAILWRASGLALDGIVVHDPGPPVVMGECEWDPPGGWKPFAILAADGAPA